MLAARPGGAEAKLSFAGLFDFLAGVDIGDVSGLPPPQQRALETVLVRAEPEDRPPERFAISAGFLSVLLSLAASERLLVAVDDLQWLDTATAEVLGFAARRVGGQPFRFLLSRRSGSVTGVEHELGSARLRRVEVGPLNLGATRQLLLRNLGLTLPAWTISPLFEATQGNPLLALELGRALAGGRTWPVGTELPVADLAANPFGARVARLSAASRRALLAAALSGHVSLPQLIAVADAAAVEELVADGLLISDGEQVRLSHPLLAVAARRQSKVPERRTLHLALAKVAGDETLRARHLALSARTQDASLAGTVAAAAAAAARRGAAHDAAELAEHARRLTPPSAAEFPERLLAFAECLMAVDDLTRAAELLGAWIDELPAGSVRARAHLLLGETGGVAEHEDHLEHALVQCGNDPALRSTALATKALLLAVVRVERIGEAEALAAQACQLARSGGAEVERLALTSLAWARILRGRPIGDLRERLPGGSESYDLYYTSVDRPAGVRLAFRGRIGEARAIFQGLLAQSEERGAARFSTVLMLQLCELELRAGDVRESSRLLGRWAESVMERQRAPYARCQSLLAGLQGRLDEVTRWAQAALPEVTGAPLDTWDRLEMLRAQGIAALLAQDPEQAADLLASVWEYTRREGVDDPGAFPTAPDLVEALVWLGRTAEAGTVASQLRDLAESQKHPWGLATARRCAAVIRLGSGYDEQAAVQLAAAAASLGELGLRFDQARSLLWLGREARRAGKRSPARRMLETAMTTFDELGADGWSGQARTELDLLGRRRVTSQAG